MTADVLATRTSSLGECRARTGSRAEDQLAGGVQGPHRQQSRGAPRWGSAGPAQAAEQRTTSLGECRASTGSRAEDHLAGGVQGLHRQQSRGAPRWGSAGPAQAAEQLSEPQRQAAMKQDSLAGSAGKSPLASAGDKSQISGLGRSSTPMHHGY